MLTLFTGMPGAGKTAALVDLLRKLETDRPMYVDGLNGLTLPHTPIDAANWHNELPDGAILVIDEVQRIWRPRGPGSKVPEAVQALEVHRHRGIDIYMTTQTPRLLDANVRGLIGRHVHIRDTGWLGRQWYEWPECNEGMSWKTCVNKAKYKLPKKAFDLYKSSSLHTKPVRKTPVALYLCMLAIICAIVGMFMVYRTINREPELAQVEPAKTAASILKSEVGAPGVSQAQMAPNGVRMIDDRVDWIPRISHKPETAPAYDALRVVATMPRVSGAICNSRGCKCVTQQGTDAGLTQAECRAWMEDRPFDAYSAPKDERPPYSQPNPENLTSGPPAPSLTLIEGPGFRDPYRTGTTSVIGAGQQQ